MVKGVFMTRDWPFLFPMKNTMAIFSTWIMISIVAMNHDFTKRSLSFFVKQEIPKLYFSWIVKGPFYFPWSMIYTPLYHPLNTFLTTRVFQESVPWSTVVLKWKNCDQINQWLNVWQNNNAGEKCLVSKKFLEPWKWFPKPALLVL